MTLSIQSKFMELPYHLKTLPPDALDVIRYLGTVDDYRAYKDDICENVGLTDRGFGKVIRRLVTKGYTVMDGSQVYRLTEQGQNSADELAAYDEANPDGESAVPDAAEQVARRLVLVVPSLVVANQSTHAYVGFHPLPGFDETSDVVARLSAVNGTLDSAQEAHFELDDSHAYQSFQVTPGQYERMRVRVEVYQLGPNPDDIVEAGGMYVDLDVTDNPDNGRAPLLAYGADVMLERME